MQFRLVLLGAVMLAVGVLAYTSIPNVHTTSTLETQPLRSEGPVAVPARGAVEISNNLTTSPGTQNELSVNITVASKSDRVSSIQFQIFARNDTRSCVNAHPSHFLVNQEISNQSIQVPVGASGPYCFVFDNQASQTPKTVTMSALVSASYEQVHVTNDGGMNVAGLGLGAFGFLVALVGFLRKTIIPWE